FTRICQVEIAILTPCGCPIVADVLRCPGTHSTVTTDPTAPNLNSRPGIDRFDGNFRLASNFSKIHQCLIPCILNSACCSLANARSPLLVKRFLERTEQLSLCQPRENTSHATLNLALV